MSSVKILPDVDKVTYGSTEKSSRSSASSSSYESQAAPAYSSLGVGGDYKQPEDEFSAVSFHDVHYQVVSLCTRKAKKILHGVSGYLPQGVNAIMGPTGSGKTSLLDILAGRKDVSGLEGSVLVNGQRQPKNFKCIAGYVVQDDVVMGTLTVRENLHFSAALRLPSSTTSRQRRKRVNKVIKELGLQYCADTKIGNEFIRGVSGGERKRTNIGMELIIEPKVLFLDEPTTGLDANTAVSVVQKLKDDLESYAHTTKCTHILLSLSRERECVIIMSIHQPRYSIFKLFDTLTLLSQGTMVYHGPSNMALSYFDTCGFPCEEHENPADFFLDVIIQCERGAMPSLPSSPIHDESFKALSQSKEVESGDAISPVNLEVSFQQSDQYQVTMKRLNGIMEDLHSAEGVGRRAPAQKVEYATSFFWQLLMVCIRSMKNLLRNPLTSVLQFIITIIFALLVGILYLQLDKKDYRNATVVNDRVGAIFFIVMNQVFSNLSAIDVFIKQKALFMHENVSGFYRVSTFFLAKVLTDMLTMRIFPLLFYAVITYFMVGFQIDVAKFFIYLLTVTMTSITATSIAFAVSARVNVTAVANLLIAMLFVFSMLFGGFLVSLDSLPVWIRWLKYLSFFRYSIEALTINEIADQCFFNTSMFPNVTKDSCSEFFNVTGKTCTLPLCTNGTHDLLERGFEVSPSWLWYDQIGLVGLTLIFLVICYLNLRTVKKVK